jgi:hypothetical protein
MYATAAFSFNQTDNGWLMSEFAFMRSFFLILLFPRIISLGRKWYTGRASTAVAKPEEVDQRNEIPTSPGEFEAPMDSRADEEPFVAEPAGETREACQFDLFFLRWSLVVDGALTTVAAFATERWHIYLGE